MLNQRNNENESVAATESGLPLGVRELEDDKIEVDLVDHIEEVPNFDDSPDDHQITCQKESNHQRQFPSSHDEMLQSAIYEDTQIDTIDAYKSEHNPIEMDSMDHDHLESEMTMHILENDDTEREQSPLLAILGPVQTTQSIEDL